MKRLKIESFGFKSLTLLNQTGEVILKNSTFEIPKAGIYYLAGDSEETHYLLKSLTALEDPQSGSVVVNGFELQEMTFEEFLPYRLNISYGFDLGGLISNRSIVDNLKICAQYHGLILDGILDEKVNQLLTRFKIGEYANERPFHVPGYVRKLACVLRAFVHEPQYVVLDSPTTGLDSERKIALGKWISEYSAASPDRVIIFTSSDEFFLEQYLNYTTLYMLDQGIEVGASSNFGDAI